MDIPKRLVHCYCPQLQRPFIKVGFCLNLTVAKNIISLQCHSCIGGTNLGEDIRKLDYGQHVVSGTPGRVFDMIRRRTLRTRGIKMLVLDEADEMLNKGFKEQIYDVYRYDLWFIMALNMSRAGVSEH